MILLFKELIHRIEKREYELDKKDKRLKRQFKIITKRDKQIEEIKQIAHNDFEERCRLTFKLEELENELDKKQKIINDMAEDFEQHMQEEVDNFLYICDKCKSNNEECHGDYCKETIIDYFTNKYEEGKG